MGKVGLLIASMLERDILTKFFSNSILFGYDFPDGQIEAAKSLWYTLIRCVIFSLVNLVIYYVVSLVGPGKNIEGPSDWYN